MHAPMGNKGRGFKIVELLVQVEVQHHPRCELRKEGVTLCSAAWAKCRFDLSALLTSHSCVRRLRPKQFMSHFEP
jgi:hypothetical protein